jgi:hypothetical protein
LTAAIDNGDLGRIVSIVAAGSWTRDRGYWMRARWAGRRSLDGVPVVDGAVANPFAHGVMTALRIADWSTPGSVCEVQCDLRRVNPIEADDTSSVRILSSGRENARFAGAITCAFTLAGPGEDDPFILVRGTAGSVRLDYTANRLSFEGGGSAAYGLDDLLGNLLEARAGRAELISPFEFTGRVHAGHRRRRGGSRARDRPALRHVAGVGVRRSAGAPGCAARHAAGGRRRPPVPGAR